MPHYVCCLPDNTGLDRYTSDETTVLVVAFSLLISVVEVSHVGSCVQGRNLPNTFARSLGVNNTWIDNYVNGRLTTLSKKQAGSRIRRRAILLYHPNWLR